MIESPSVAITGRGVLCSIGATVPLFEEALREGRSRFTSLEGEGEVGVAALIRDFSWKKWTEMLRETEPELATKARRVLNNTTDSTRWSAYAAVEAMREARVPEEARGEVGIIIAGSNLAQSYVAENAVSFLGSEGLRGRLNARFALSSLDTNQIGCLSEILALRGMGFTLGAASASGNAALFNACQWIRHGVLERCLVVGAGADFSRMELEAYARLGAAACGKYRNAPDGACRPFDLEHKGFVWGQGCGAVLLEAPAVARARGATVYGEIVGSSLLLDGNHLPDPDRDGEVRAMRMALNDAALTPNEIGYINAHGSASPLGDRTECAAIAEVFAGELHRVVVNSTKSLTGHCMSAGGVIELLSTLMQLNGGFIHPNRNLVQPISSKIRFASRAVEPLNADYALSNGFGFGGFNSSLVIKKGN